MLAGLVVAMAAAGIGAAIVFDPDQGRIEETTKTAIAAAFRGDANELATRLESASVRPRGRGVPAGEDESSLYRRMTGARVEGLTVTRRQGKRAVTTGRISYAESFRLSSEAGRLQPELASGERMVSQRFEMDLVKRAGNQSRWAATSLRLDPARTRGRNPSPSAQELTEAASTAQAALKGAFRLDQDEAASAYASRQHRFYAIAKDDTAPTIDRDTTSEPLAEAANATSADCFLDSLDRSQAASVSGTPSAAAAVGDGALQRAEVEGRLEVTASSFECDAGPSEQTGALTYKAELVRAPGPGGRWFTTRLAVLALDADLPIDLYDASSSFGTSSQQDSADWMGVSDDSELGE